MHSEEIRKALFPHEVKIDELKAENDTLKKQVENYIVETMRYKMLRDMGVVITGQGDGALYLQGDEMDEWFKNKPRLSGFGNAEVHAEGHPVNYNTTPRTKK